MQIRRLIPLALGFAVVLTGCATPADDPTEVPDGISVAVYQTRTDVGPRKLEISITNGTEGPVTVTGVRFESEQFAEVAVWQKESTTVPAGATRDLPVQLAAPNCDAENPEPIVEFDYELADGTTGTARTVADDRIDRLPALMVEDCMAEAVSDIVELTIVSPPRPTTIAGMPVFELDVTAEPTGAEGAVELLLLSSTTLLMPADPASGMPVTEQPLGVTIDGTGDPSVVTLLLTAGRCDPHALLEDKRGTIMPIDVTVGETAGRIYIASADAVRGAIYDVVSQSCGY